MVCKEKETIILKLHDACQKLLFEQANLRDKIVIFYTTVCTIYMVELIPQTLQLKSKSVLGFISIIGVICSIRIIGHRAWNLQYVKCIKALNGILIMDRTLCKEEEIKGFFANAMKDMDDIRVLSLFNSIGNLAVLCFSILNTIPFWIWKFERGDKSSLIICLIYTVVYCIGMECYLFIRLKKANTIPTWILQF